MQTVDLARPRAPFLLLLLALLLVTLCWPAFVNGHPFVFPDTLNYLRGVNRMAQQVTGYASEWLSYPVSDPSVPNGERIIMLGRSPAYGALLFVAQFLTRSFWPAVLVQAGLTAACIMLTLSRLGGSNGAGPGAPFLAGRALLLALVTPVAFFASFLMPDIFAPLAVLATIHLALLWPVLRRWERLFWTAVLAAGLLVHSANLLIIGGLLALCIALRLVGLSLSARGLAVAVAVLAGGVGYELAFPKAVQAATATAPIRPPFVTARIVADGPGYAFLRDSCPGSGFLLCRYVDRLPLESDTFLWGMSPEPGVFSVIGARERRVLASEQGRFVLAVLADRPLDLAASSLRSAGRQLGMLRLGEFNYPADEERAILPQLVPRERAHYRASRAFAGTMPTSLPEALTLVSLVAAAGWILFYLAAVRPRDPQRRSRILFLALVAAALLINAAVCGALSTPHDRYQARMIWLLPLAALCLPGRRALRRQPAGPARESTPRG